MKALATEPVKEEEGVYAGSPAIWSTINDGRFLYFYYKYKDAFLDPVCQIYLKCEYDLPTYKNETERLSQIREEYQGRIQKINYNTKDFRYPAYVTIFENDGCYEYALLDEENYSIIYIFLQWTEEKNIEFADIYLPYNYNCAVSTDRSFFIYSFWDSEHGWYYVVPRKK